MLEKFKGIIDSEEKALNDFAQDVVNYTQRTADYYEEKKYKFLTISIGMLGFGATLIGVFKEQYWLVVGSLIMMVFSLLSIIIYAAGSMPTPELKKEFKASLRSGAYNINRKKSMEENYNIYAKKFKQITKKDILNDNISQAMTLFYLCDAKRRVIEKMSSFILVGLSGFFGSVLIYSTHFLS